MENRYQVQDSIVEIQVVCKGKVYVTTIDKKNLDKISHIRSWYGIERSNGIYVCGSYRGRKVFMHNLILGTPKDLVGDHINHNTLDNTEDNLRAVTRAVNNRNKSGAYRSSVSGIRGVQKHGNKWVARVKYNGVRVVDESYDNLLDAVMAVVAGRNRYHGVTQVTRKPIN